jgi:hypothetical protein
MFGPFEDEDDENPMPWQDSSDQMAHIMQNSMSINSFRDKALFMFNALLIERLEMHKKKKKNEFRLSVEQLADQRKFLSCEELEQIIRDCSKTNVDEPDIPEGLYAIGGHTPQEAMAQMRKLIEAVLNRILSNITQQAVAADLLDCMFDGDNDAFMFSVSEKGKAEVERVIAEKKAKSAAKAAKKAGTPSPPTA